MISIGNIAVGGRAKTPLVARVAAILRDAGERPAVLTRGYRRDDESSLVIVRDASGIRADLARAGDEPLMLARQLEGTVIVACADRYQGGTVAERDYGCTVHVLDDGFQHVQLARDLDIVLVSRDDVERPVTLPSGRLREPLDTIRAADAVVALDAADLGCIACGARVWHARRKMEPARLVEPAGAIATPSGGSVIAIAGIAQPARFFDDLRATGWPVSRTIGFADHHRYSAADVAAILRAAREDGASMLVTTEKDLVRLLPFRPFPLPVAYVPLTLAIEPAAEFSAWLLASVARAREAA